MTPLPISPPAEPAPPPRRRRRIPAFHPVPVAARRDGWTPARQGAFVGLLAETGSVEAACRALGMGKHSAYRLRKRPGAAGFAAAWDAALMKSHRAVDPASAKSTGLPAGYRCRTGRLQVVMDRGRYAASYWKADNTALLQFAAQLDRALRQGAPGAARRGGLNPAPASRLGAASPLTAPAGAVPAWRASPQMRALVAALEVSE